MAVIAVICAYQEQSLLPGCLASLEGKVDRIVLVDGRYENFPGKGATSTDKTVEIARAFGAEIILPPNNQLWPDQPTKRSAYLVGKEGDWYLRIDADERLIGELPDVSTLDPTKGYSIYMKWPKGCMHTTVPCLFCHRGVMHYDRVHCALWSDDRLISRRRDCPMLDGVWFQHLKEYRLPERKEQKRLYYLWQRENERAFRSEWNI